MEGTHENFLMVLYRFYVPRFSNLEGDYTHLENVDYKQLAAFVATTQLLGATCIRELRNTVKAGNLSNAKKVVMHLP